MRTVSLGLANALDRNAAAPAAAELIRKCRRFMRAPCLCMVSQSGGKGVTGTGGNGTVASVNKKRSVNPLGPRRLGMRRSCQAGGHRHMNEPGHVGHMKFFHQRL